MQYGITLRGMGALGSDAGVDGGYASTLAAKGDCSGYQSLVDTYTRLAAKTDKSTGTRQQAVVAGGDLPGAQLAAEELVEQGKEQEAIVGLDQQQGRMAGLGGQGQSGVEPAKPATNDHNGGSLRGRPGAVGSGRGGGGR